MYKAILMRLTLCLFTVGTCIPGFLVGGQLIPGAVEDIGFRGNTVMRYPSSSHSTLFQNYPKSNGLVAPMNRALSLPQSLSPLPTNAGSMTGFQLFGGYKNKRSNSNTRASRVCGDHLIMLLFLACQGNTSPGLQGLVEEIREFGDITQKKRSGMRTQMAEYVGSNRPYGLARMCCTDRPCTREFLQEFCF